MMMTTVFAHCKALAHTSIQNSELLNSTLGWLDSQFFPSLQKEIGVCRMMMVEKK